MTNTILTSSGSSTTIGEVFVEEGKFVVLNCSSFDGTGGSSTWKFANLAKWEQSSDVENVFTIYTDGNLINPKLNSSKFSLMVDTEKREYNLKINDFSTSDEGSYRCDFLWNGSWYTHIYNIYVQSKYQMIIFAYILLHKQLT